jgi:hypothetical protein
MVDANILMKNRMRWMICTTSWHWIVLKKVISIDEKNETAEFEYWRWGYEFCLTEIFPFNVFNSNYYGYIAIKM